MRRVSYQAILGDGGDEGGSAAGAVYVGLGDGAIGTRRKDARREVGVALSKPQRRWLQQAVELSGSAVDEGAVLRALVDLGMELEIDWPVLASAKSLRRAVRESVMVRRRTAG